MARKLPLRDASPADLYLWEFWVEKLDYRETPDLEDELFRPHVRVSRPGILQSERGADALITLRVEVSQEAVRSIDLTIVGQFELFPDEETRGAEHEMPMEMLAYNGTAILFGAARGVIESVTGVSGYGRMHVPSVNIAELLDR